MPKRPDVSIIDFNDMITVKLHHEGREDTVITLSRADAMEITIALDEHFERSFMPLGKGGN